MWIFSPLAWMLVSTSLAAICARAGWRRGARIGIFLSLSSVAAMTPLVANALLALLERPPERVDPECGISPPRLIIVLAGGVDRFALDATDFAALSIASRRRMDSAIDRWRARPSSMLVAVGGSTRSGGVAESALLVTYAMRLGVHAGALRAEVRSATTWENAFGVAAMFPAERRVVLVTSAAHMARARFAFAQAGIATCPVRSDVRWTEATLPYSLLPRSSALRKSEAAIHEIVGMMAYRLRALG